MRPLTILLLAVVAGFGCGLRRVPAAVLERLPYEAKVELLEAENELAVAVDRLDEVRSQVLRARDELRRAKGRLDAARGEVGVAADPGAREVATLAVDEADARVTWLRARQRRDARDEAVAAKGLDCALARYELARLAAVRKAKVEGSEALEPERFERQLARCEAERGELEEATRVTAADAEAARASWDAARAALAKKTFDARASPYVE
jgi:hypothetical protein